jgi:hypothetical protein
MSAQSITCTCATCPGSSCTCGCQNIATAPRPGCKCGAACACGPSCSCQAA